ncbi:hypothetical protein K438DRAFT_2017280 [Mycena galopus ATCC 62051]|nr:hypothetical protein K438DRAFT_2017280 [Mycena galopus ATCC 62051]
MAQVDIAGYLSGWKTQTFSALPNEDVQLWLCDIRYGLKQRRVPRADWVPVAYHFLGPELQGVLGEVQEGIEKLEPGGWNWDRFTSSLIVIHDRVKKDAAENDPETIGAAVSRLRRDHPVTTAAAGIGLIALGGVVVGPAILAGTLKILGFHVTGIAGGSIAAGIKTAVYGGYVAGRSAVAAAGPVRALSAGAMSLGAWAGFEVHAPNENIETVATETAPLEDASATPGDDKGLNNSTVAAEPDNSAESTSLDVDEHTLSSASMNGNSGSDNVQLISLEDNGSAEPPTTIHTKKDTNIGPVAAEPALSEDASATPGDDKGLDNSTVAAEPDSSAESISLDVDEHAGSSASMTGDGGGSDNAQLISLEDNGSAESAATTHAEKGTNIDPVAAEAAPAEDASATPGDDKGLDNSTIPAEPDNSAESTSLEVDEHTGSPAFMAGNNSGSDNTQLISVGDNGSAESAATTHAEKGPNIGPIATETAPSEDASVTPGDDKGLDNSIVAAEPDNSAESTSLDVDEHMLSRASVTGSSNNAEPIPLKDDESAESSATAHAEKGPNIGPIVAGPVALADDEQTVSAATTTDDDKSSISSRDVRTE